MGTNKKIIQVILEDEYAEKFEYLREQDDRSASKMGYKMIKQYIDQYEQFNGKIKLEP